MQPRQIGMRAPALHRLDRRAQRRPPPRAPGCAEQHVTDLRKPKCSVQPGVRARQNLVPGLLLGKKAQHGGHCLVRQRTIRLHARQELSGPQEIAGETGELEPFQPYLGPAGPVRRHTPECGRRILVALVVQRQLGAQQDRRHLVRPHPVQPPGQKPG